MKTRNKTRYTYRLTKKYPHIVTKMLDEIPQEKLIYGRVLDLSFGGGQFLVEVEKRKAAAGLSDQQIRETTFGIESSLHSVNYVLNKFNMQSTLIAYDYKDLKDMHFDVIVGNPPYNSGEVTIYHHFVEKAIKMNPDYLTMIIPSRWFITGKGLDEFRKLMLDQEHISKIVDYPSSKDVFQTVDIEGGVCYFVWDKSHRGNTNLTTAANSIETTRSINIRKYDIIIRFKEQEDVLEKVKRKCTEFMSDVVSKVKPFGLETNEKLLEKGNILVYSRGGKIGYVDELPEIHKSFYKWKTILAEARGSSGINSQITGKPKVVAPNTACTATYIIVDSFDTQQEAENLAAYIKTKFFRFMLSILKITQHGNRKTYAFVPKLDMSRKWTDQELYRYFELTDHEIDFIEKMIKEIK